MATGLAVPTDRPLDDLTAELTTMLGSPDPVLRDGTAYPALATWIGRGVYDDLLIGLGDGMAAGLTVGLGEVDTDSVFRRSFSALVLAECLDRDNAEHLLPAGTVLEWGDRIASWYLRERDVRGYVPGKGWAHAIAHGADAIGVLSGSRHLGAPELTVMLDVLADRLLARSTATLAAGETDRMALATVRLLHRGLLGIDVLEPWIRRIADHAGTMGSTEDRDPFLDGADPQAFLRSLYLQLSIGPERPAVRSDLVLVLVEALRATNPAYLTPG